MTITAGVNVSGLVRERFYHTFPRMTQKQTGRPHLPDGEAKDVIVQTRVSEADRDLLQQAADMAGVKLAHWIRDRILAAAKTELRRK